MASEQRSFRLSKSTLDLLDGWADYTGESRNALADRLLNEALRMQRHPLIRFQTGASGRRQAMLVATRLHIYQVISTVRFGGGGIKEAAEYFSLPEREVQAAVDYYADFKDEIDEDFALALRFEADERARWERQQRALV
jgi:hypothetical protein